MDRGYPEGLNLQKVPTTPCFVVGSAQLERNLSILAKVKARTGCRILLALKGFAMYSIFPMLRPVLDGVCASSPHEARLGREEFGGEVHTFAAAYSEADVRELLGYTDHLDFNSFNQWHRFKELVQTEAPHLRCGLRVNPEQSEAPVPMYDPCAPKSRLGIRRPDFDGQSLAGISGLHFHTLCEQNAPALERTLAAFTDKFAGFFPDLDWVNFGGGHLITRPDYDIDLLCRLLINFRLQYGLEIYLEPGEAVALDAGILVTTVLDIVHNEMAIAILDTSAAAHMPDVLEMPYRPGIAGTGLPGEFPHTYRLAGLSCLAGDVIGDYSFPEPLRVGDRLAFLDMAHYTMVKTNTFNGVQLPAIALYDAKTDALQIIRRFGYDDFKNRLS